MSWAARWPRPDPGQLIEWPAAFGTRFTIFVDTEEEFDWSAPLDRHERSVESIGAVPAMHARFAARGIAPIYLVDHPVATDARAIALLQPLLADGATAVGAQLHPWVNPPFAADEDSFAGALPATLERAKLDVLTDAITAAFGAPLAYRAGRYGIGPATANALIARGYRLDTSVRARFEYRAAGGPDFSAVGSDAHRLGPDGALIELPLTTVFTGLLRRAGSGLHPLAGRVSRGRGVLARSRLLSRVPLTPEGVSAREAVEAIRIAHDDGVRVLNFSFHSPSLVPGNTPYVRDASDLATFNRWWDVVFDALDQRGIRPASLSEVLAAVDGAGGPGRT